MDMEIVKSVAPLASLAVPFINAIVETRLKPKLQQLLANGKIEREMMEHSVFGKFTEYLNRSYERQSSISTVVFQNQPKQLDDLYIPLTIERSSQQDDKQRILIDVYPESLIPEHQKVLLTDTAGMGKSTIMKFLFLQCIRENKGIPIFVELRQLSTEKNIIDIIYNDLNPVDDNINREFILKLIREGEFVFFLDGYDEIPFADREEVTRHLQDFISKAGENDFILTSRPETALASFANFQQFAVKPLEKDEAFALIRRYGEGASVAEQLIKELQKQTNKIEEFLTNPLLVSLLYKAYSYKPTVPQKNHTFYRQVYDALFENHDLSKPGAFKREKHSGLDIDDFDSVLRVLGFLTVKQGQVEYEKDDLLKRIADARQQCPGLEFKDNDFLRDLITTVPLFVRDGHYYRWNHKSIQEYFAAQYICRDAKANQSVILRAIVASKQNQRYANVLDLCYDIDYKTFRNTLLLDLINEFLEFCDNSYEELDRKIISESSISFRKQLCFGFEFLLFSNDFLQKHRCEDDSDYSDFENMSRKALEINFLTDATSMHRATVWSDEGGVLIVAKRENVLISVLNRKQDALVSKTKELRIVQKYSEASDGTTIQSWRSAVPDDVCGAIELCKVDDRPNTKVNHPNIFDKTNSLLTHIEFLILDIKKCRILRSEIQTDLEQEQKADSFIGAM